MFYIVRKLLELHSYWNNECSDTRIKDWFLMSNPLQTLLIIAAYIYFILKLGPALMKDRQPFKLNGLLKVYNLVQVIASFIIVFKAFQLGYFQKFNFICADVDLSESEDTMAFIFYGYMYFILKIVDLLDTIFFVLRKKQNQITFLHIYHHAGMVALTWTGIKYFPGGHSAFLPIINSFVHSVMYFYYFLTAINESYKKNIWWKKHITQLQIFQFGLVALHWILLALKPWLAPDCTYPRWPVLILIPQNLFMCSLFIDFYIKSYIKPERKRKAND